MDQGAIVSNDTILFPTTTSLRKAVRRCVDAEGYSHGVKKRICRYSHKYMEWFDSTLLSTYYAPVLICAAAILVAGEVAPDNHFLRCDIERTIVTSLTGGDEKFVERCLRELDLSVSLRETTEKVYLFDRSARHFNAADFKIIWKKR